MLACSVEVSFVKSPLCDGFRNSSTVELVTLCAAGVRDSSRQLSFAPVSATSFWEWHQNDGRAAGIGDHHFPQQAARIVRAAHGPADAVPAGIFHVFHHQPDHFIAVGRAVIQLQVEVLSRDAATRAAATGAAAGR